MKEAPHLGYMKSEPLGELGVDAGEDRGTF